MKILIAYDSSRGSKMIPKDMLRAGLPSEAQALILSVIDCNQPTETATKVKAAQQSVIDAAAIVQRSFPQWRVTTETPSGPPANTILRRAHEWAPHLIIVGTHGRPVLRRLFLGSVSMALVHESECSVRVVRSGFPQRTEPPRLVVGNDGSMRAKAAIHEIASRQWPHGTQVVVVAVLEPDNLGDDVVSKGSLTERPEGSRQHLARVVQESVDELACAGLIAHGTVAEGDPSQILFEESERVEADAVFVGARGWSRLGGLLLGSVSGRLAGQARCSVEIVRGKEPATE